MPDVIGVDWGSTRLRAWLVGRDGAARDALAADTGILFGRADDLRAALVHHLQPWLTDASLVVGVGMLGSRTGLLDAGYLHLPADRTAWVAAAVDAGTIADVPFVVLPGIAKHGAEPDVMRGEEFQVYAALAAGEPDGTFVCPGTHSKWVATRGGSIVDLRTYATGELFAAWRRESSLAGLVADVDQTDGGFAYGLAAARRRGASVTAAIFGLRAAVLLGALPAAHALDALSGLLIGTEVAHALALRHRRRPRAVGGVRIIGEGALVGKYLEALSNAGQDARAVTVDSARALAGLAQVAR